MSEYNKEKLLNLLESVLGQSYEQSSDYIFYCPNCNHHKPKLYVNIDNSSPKFGRWHCWVCEIKGKKLFTLFKKINCEREYFNKLKEILGEDYYIYKNINKSVEEKIELPKEFIPLWKENQSIESRHAMTYLKRRKITKDDILKYRLGYVEEGRYKNRIIIPSYDCDGNLNYFTSRIYYDNDSITYLNPKISRDIIGFDVFINWSLPIIIVEGVMDAITIKRNVIPLFGKTILNKLKEKIIKLNVKNVFIALDEDALKNAIEIAGYFLSEEINVYIVELIEDPAKIGLDNFFDLLDNSKKLEFKDILKYKML